MEIHKYKRLLHAEAQCLLATNHSRQGFTWGSVMHAIHARDEDLTAHTHAAHSDRRPRMHAFHPPMAPEDVKLANTCTRVHNGL